MKSTLVYTSFTPYHGMPLPVRLPLTSQSLFHSGASVVVLHCPAWPLSLAHALKALVSCCAKSLYSLVYSSCSLGALWQRSSINCAWRSLSCLYVSLAA